MQIEGQDWHVKEAKHDDDQTSDEQVQNEDNVSIAVVDTKPKW